MRRVLSIALLLAGCLRGQSAATASIAGTVVDQTGAPLAGIHVRLMTGDFNADDVQAAYGATSDSAGRFAVEGLKPGLYITMAQRAGYVQSSTDSPMGFAFTAVKAGQHLTDYKVVLTARAVIAGHVVDEYGDPVQGVNVQTEPAKGERPQGAMMGNQNSPTNDRGEFRIICAPGKYYVRAALDSMQQEGPEIRTDGSSGAVFASTYYPSAADAGSASAVAVGPGQDVAGIEIALRRMTTATTARTFTISGSVSGIPENESALVRLRSGEKPDELRSDSDGMGTTPEGKFAFAGLPPGYYSVEASYSNGKTPLHSRPVRLHLEASDETGLQLTLAPGEDLSGTLQILGDAQPGKGKLTVRLEPDGWGGEAGISAEVEPDGSFHLHDVAPSRFKLVIDPMPENGYLKEIALDGKIVPGGLLDFAQGVGGSRIKLTVSRGGGQISGRVLDKNGEPVVGLVMVYFGIDFKQRDEASLIRVSDGKYSFNAMPPGKYRIFAVDVAEMMQAFSGGDDAMQRLFDAAEEIEVKEGDRIVKDLLAATKMPDKKERP
jgi:hypothetical protein